MQVNVKTSILQQRMSFTPTKGFVINSLRGLKDLTSLLEIAIILELIEINGANFAPIFF